MCTCLSCVYVYIFMCVFMVTCSHVCLCVYVHVCLCVHVHVYEGVHVETRGPCCLSLLLPALYFSESLSLKLWWVW